MSDFEFKIRHHKETLWGMPAETGWSVSLPHQCDSWEISGSRWSPVTREKAIFDLKKFIEEAKEALAALEKGEELNLSQNDLDEDKEW